MNAKKKQKLQDKAPKPNSFSFGATQYIKGAQDERREFAFGTHPWRR